MRVWVDLYNYMLDSCDDLRETVVYNRDDCMFGKNCCSW